MIFAKVADHGHNPYLDETENLNALFGFLKAVK